MRGFFLEGDTSRDLEGDAGGGVAGRYSTGRAGRGGELKEVSLRILSACILELTI